VIDEIFELISDIFLDFIPNRILKIVVIIVGIVTVGFGVQLLSESLWTGGVLTTIGLFLVGGPLLSLIG
jgi:hypothetical protein